MLFFNEFLNEELEKMSSFKLSWPAELQTAICEVKAALRVHKHNLSQPCHTSAYESGKFLDDKVRKLLSLKSYSDYGHMNQII
jgi:hypothetical protein